MKKYKNLFVTALLGLVTALIILSLLRTQAYRYPGIIDAISQFVILYGLPAGFIVAFLGSSWFILFPTELVIVPFLTLFANPWLAILIFATGSTLADILNFWTGRHFGRPWVEKRLSKEKLDKVQSYFDRWGLPTLFFFGVIGPVTSYDIVAVFIGTFWKTSMKHFIVLTFMVRVMHFAVVWGASSVLLRLAGF